MEKDVIVYGLEVEQTQVDDKPVELAKMGVSIACSHTFGSRRFRFYDRESIQKLERMAEDLSRADLVVGFGNLTRDKKVLAGVGVTYAAKQEVDLYQMILEAWWQLEIPPDTEKWPTSYPDKEEFYEGWDIDDILQGTLDLEKYEHLITLDGKLVPGKEDLCLAWEKGKIADVIYSCREKVDKTRLLFKWVAKNPWVKNARGNKVELDGDICEDFLNCFTQKESEQTEGASKATKPMPSKPVVKATHWHNLLRAKVVIVGQQGNCVLFRQDLGGGKLGSKVEGKWENLVPIEQPGGTSKHIKKMEPFPLKLQDD